MEQPSYAFGASGVPLMGETLGANLDRIAATFPEKEAVVSCHQGRRMTYGQLRAATDEFARGLVALGVRHGDRVGIWSTNTIEWVIAQFATPKIGAILVNVNPAYRSSEASYALRQSGVSVLLTQVRHKTSEYVEILREIGDGLPALRTIVLIGDDELQAPLPGAMRWDDVRAAAENVSDERLRERSAAVQFDEAINVQYTSGTTGFPKGATLSHHNILNNGFFIGEGCRYSEVDRVCVPVPFYHCFGMVLGNLAIVTHGATIVIPNYSFDPVLTLEAVQRERCTSLYGVPTMFIAELALPNFSSYDCSSLRTGIMAGSPCPVEIMKRVQTEMHMPEVTICYGMTETSPVSTQTAVDDPLDKRTGTVGRVHPHLEVKIVDESGAIVPRGAPGELCTRGYSVMLGYWNDPENTAASIDAARYMHTGDIATMDAEGYLNIAGRIKDMVIRGGENVYPREIEEFLYAHPAIKDVSVIGLPDEKYGEELCAWVILNEDASASEEDIRAFCRGKIAHYKVPRYVRFVGEFPMTVSGKVQKYKMREISTAELGLESAAKIVTA
ncbi:MAG TPA: AMP-binding protein [Candidatus Baltobacteraceae bacterium]|nr:AMP-binding protein [Candidatus Baltobacteraceae bacterium]